MLGYVLANTRRFWYVPDFYVWGTQGWAQMDIVMIENADSGISVLYDPVSLGDVSQTVLFSDLFDDKGNALPTSINNPKVLIKPKGENSAFIVGQEASQTFKIARPGELDDSVKVDLIVMEMN